MTKPQRTAPLLATVFLLLFTGALASKSLNLSPKKKARGDGGNLRASSSSAASAPTKPAEFAYPDVTLQCCRINSGNDRIQSWMQSNGDNGYLFLDLVSCCLAHFHKDVDSCMDASREIARLGRSSVGEYEDFADPNPNRSDTVAVRQRKLGKSGKSSAQYYQLPHSPVSDYYHSGNGKSGKASISAKTAKSADISHLPTQIDPVPPPTPIIPGEKRLEVVMGGSMKVMNSNVPPMESDEIKTLAKVYEQTILRSIYDGYEVDVYSIGGVSVGSDGSYSSKGSLGMFYRRNLQSSSDVLFNLRTVKPCPECSQVEASIVGADVFTQAFTVLQEDAESGKLTAIFCVVAEMANVIDDPCVEEITDVVGESLTMDKVRTDSEPSPTPPTPSEPNPPPSTMTPITAPPFTSAGSTVAPSTLPPGTSLPPVTTLPPVVGTPPPSIAGSTVAPSTLPPGTSLPPVTTLPPVVGTPPPSIAGSTVAPSTLPPGTSLPPVTTLPPVVGTSSPSIAGITVAPSTLPPGTSPPPVTTLPPVVGTPPPVTAGSTVAPSLTAGPLYFNGFEDTSYPQNPEWTVQGDGLWDLSTERANSGVYSMKSPNFMTNPDDLTPKTANVTLTTDPAWPGGTLVFSILAGVELPFDDLVYYLDDQQVGQATMMTDFETREIILSPGGHTVTFSYKYNPNGLTVFPPPMSDRIGAAFIDDVYFLPEGVTRSPVVIATGTGPPVLPVSPLPPTLPPVVGTPPPSIAGITVAPSTLPPGTSLPPVTTLPPVNSTCPPALSPTGEALPVEGALFDGFETGDFSLYNWTVSGEKSWIVDETQAYEGIFSAHVRTEDISGSGNYSQLDLTVPLETTSFIQFYFYAPVAMPFESFDLQVDGQFLTTLVSEDEEIVWTQGGSIIPSGVHTISWRLLRNPGGAPEDMILDLPNPPFRVGEAWLDYVKIVPSTSSFSEEWDSGAFTANPWTFSGDSAAWSIQDFGGERGMSATADSEFICGNTGVSDLSIDIITEQGGILKFQVLPKVQGPFEIVNVLVDDVVVLTFAESSEDWLAQEINIQPGKREVTFQLAKNPGGFPADVMPPPPSPPVEGQVWLDSIVFETPTS
ncbi:hypothetical protein ACHAW5_009801 [Stephanodiscus triporus]|uniref:Uncharacterized protein n=1 Tax=Stephanodiscus triporus TaxID=2934178 RepID=A0ABD3NVG0_9STRA